MTIWVIALVVLLINIPFGALRALEKKYSFKWFLYIHLPVPVVICLRIYSGIGYELYTYPILITAFFAGQLIGRKYLAKKFAGKRTKTAHVQPKLDFALSLKKKQG